MDTPATPRRPLPIGIQNLREIREGGHYYVDKTGLAIDLIASGKLFFLSRPRRFGKSLLVDTFKELFEGNRPLFEGLAAETRWDWSKRHPVIRISFGNGVLHGRSELHRRIRSNLRDNRAALSLPRPDDIDPDDTSDDLARLIQQARQAQAWSCWSMSTTSPSSTTSTTRPSPARWATACATSTPCSRTPTHT